MSNFFSPIFPYVNIEKCFFLKVNEAEAIRRLGGVVVGITGRGGIVGGHASERIDFPRVTIENSGDLGAFLDQVSGLTQTSLA